MTSLPLLDQHQCPLHQHHHQIPPGEDDRLRNSAVQPMGKWRNMQKTPSRFACFLTLVTYRHLLLECKYSYGRYPGVYLCYFSVHVYIGKRSIKEKWIPSHQFRQRRQIDFCEDSNVKRSVLFVLDTSGSIGRQTFQRMTAALSSLTPFFCKPVQFALMTFNERRWLEFCFNCFENTLAGRTAAGEAIANATYRYGLAHTFEC